MAKSLQETFETVAKHLLKQGKPANSDLGCVYRTADGLKCAVGGLIPDNKYDPGFESKRVGQCSALRAVLKEEGYLNDAQLATEQVFSHFTPELKLLDQLQTVHDSWNPVHWKEELARVGRRNFLDTAFLDSLELGQ